MPMDDGFNLYYINNEINLLQGYRDRAYVSNILCEECSSYYNRLKSLSSFPLIISSSIMSILNSSSFNSDTMKIPKIIK